jgi:DNA-binding winged helix-turn-helix (wHTH) protein
VISGFGEFTLDDERRVLSRAGHPLHLTPKAFDLLTVLVAEAPRVVGKAELHARVWQNTFISDTTLVGVIKEIRRAIGDTGHAPIIRTVHRVGYACAAPVTRERAAPADHAWQWLVLIGRRFSLRQGENIVGRDPLAQIWIDAGGVSRRHAAIRVDGATACIEDLGSKNGTAVGGMRIGTAVSLHDGDHIAFGTVTAVYRMSTTGLPTETVNHVAGRPSQGQPASGH